MTTHDEAFLQQVRPYVEQLHKNGEPYVWRLKLSKTTFGQIEKALKKSIKSHHKDTKHLISDEFAPCIIVYIAEWYKRCYESPQSRSELNDFGSNEWKSIWEHCGFDNWEKYVYQQYEGASHRWLDSLYAMGGLALPFRLNQNYHDLLLKLCRLYHKEDISYEEISRVNGSISFRQSILNEHSLYHYFKQTLSGNPPFNEEELEDTNSDCSLLIREIKRADNKSREEKFSFDWLIRNVPEREYMHRRLRISLKPESEGKYRQYISYERLRDWGIQNPQNVSRLRFSLQFEDQDAIIKACDFENPLFIFSNRGIEDGHFVCWSTSDEVIASHIPAKSFTKVQLWLKADDNEPIRVRNHYLKYDETLHLFRRTQERFEWESRTNNQSDSAVVFSDRWREVTSDGHLHMSRKSFYDSIEGESIPYNWCNIFEKIELSDERNTKIFDCRKGKDYVFPKCYPNDIQYKEGFTVEHHYMERYDEDDDDGELKVEYVPILFGYGITNLISIHYESKDDKEGRVCEPYCIKHKVGNRYEIVNCENDLNYGIEELLILVTESSLSIRLKVFYVPWTNDQGCPVVRDFDRNEVCVAGIKRENDYQRDNIEKDPCLHLKLGKEDDYVVVDIFRPQTIVELFQNNKLIEYYDNRDNGIKIPLILCKEFRVRDYSPEGVLDYQCGNLMKKYSSIYPLNPNYGMRNDWQIQTVSEDAIFNYIHLCFFDTRDNDRADWYAMDYRGLPQPIESSVLNSWRGPGIIFDSMLSSFRRHCHEMKIKNGVGLGNRINTNMSYLELYDMAARHRAYFFMFQPLGRMVNNNSLIEDLLLPIINRSTNGLSDKEIRDLQRFAFEFNFSWSDKLNEWHNQSEDRAKVNDVIYRITTLE